MLGVVLEVVDGDCSLRQLKQHVSTCFRSSTEPYPLCLRTLSRVVTSSGWEHFSLGFSTTDRRWSSESWSLAPGFFCSNSSKALLAGLVRHRTVGLHLELQYPVAGEALRRHVNALLGRVQSTSSYGQAWVKEHCRFNSRACKAGLIGGGVSIHSRLISFQQLRAASHFKSFPFASTR